MSDRGPRTHLVSAAIVAALVLGGELGAQTCARQRADSLINAGWIRLRSGAARSADSAFSAALSVCPRDAGALTGRGYAALNQARLANARAYFDSALARQPESYDALTGRGLVAWRTNDLATARTAFVRVLAIAPNDSLAQSYVRRIPAPVDSTLLPRRARPETTTIVARVAPRRFEVQDAAGRWAPLWIKAVNIGAALPGRHPSEFPDDDGTYDEWLALTARMGANTVRVYTIHPPHFYRALDRWNRAHPDSALWLIHGVWTELPPGAREENYDDRAWNAAFTAEMHRVVDLLHGNAAIQPRAGHASGLYDVDVSRWTLGYIIGREWEPFSVVAFAKKFPARRAFNGTYVAVHDGNAVDVWLAQFCDAMIAYEMRRYNAQRPVAYTNWPTLDPLTHPTESSRAEETALMTRRGERAPEPSREYDNDAIGLDAMRWRAQPTFSAGLFASFHAYPYYPDFMLFDPGYARAESPWGRSNYFGYLRDLVAHHGDMPVVISEYGVPSSRGNAHVQPQGFDHGGHDERAQA
ncbi:MAG TPA: tetratricopeptide repeat protein, partial [Gemmatimonadaceae bacterium]|nr:tetratricopeptide repeat protein [Gemmatimonadaceae bacterium]